MTPSAPVPSRLDRAPGPSRLDRTRAAARGCPCAVALGLLVILVLGGPTRALAQQPQQERDAGPFSQGRLGFSFGMATGGFGSSRYYVVGASFGVFVLDGLEVALAAEHWFAADPGISKLSPQVRYIAHVVPFFHPYLGAFYRHWFVGDGFDDVDTLGGRFGAVGVSSGGLVLGAGVVYEQILSECLEDCYDIYPEINASLYF